MSESLQQRALDQTTDTSVGNGRETPVDSPMRPSPPLQLPRSFGRYELQRLLGHGAMGTVYLARDSQLDRLVALKIPRLQQDDAVAWRDRFLSEAKAAATLHHPNICPVFEVAEAESQLYLTMAYIEGETLAARLRHGGPLTPRHAAELIRKLSLAIAEAHERGIVHRDLKPANIMIDRRGEPVIMDFGLALRVAASDDLRLTLSGVAMGTPCYMPPEQAGGDHEAIGPAADVYSLGIILFELVTGQVPFQGKTFGKLLAQIERDPAPLPQSINAAVDEHLTAIILRALAKSPHDRFPSGTAMADALDAYLAGKSAPAALLASTHALVPDKPFPNSEIPSKPQATGSWPPARRVTLGILGLLAAVLLGVIVYIQTDKGTLVVELSDPKAQVDVKVDGQEVILDPDGKAIRVRAGKNKLLEVSGKDFKTVSERFDLTRNGTTRVSVKLEPPPGAPGKPPGGDAPSPPDKPVKKPAIAVKPVPAQPVPYPEEPTLIELPGWQMLTDANQLQMQTWIDERKAEKQSLMWLDVVMIGEEPVFAAVAALDSRDPNWNAFLDLTALESNDVSELAKRIPTTDLIVTSLGGFIKDKKLTGVALYRRGKANCIAGLADTFNGKRNVDAGVAQGYVVHLMRPVAAPGGPPYWGLYLESAIATPSRHDFELSEEELTDVLEAQRGAGACPVSVVPYELNGQRQFSATFRDDPQTRPWELVRDLTASELKAKAPELSKQGLTPLSITVYPHDGAVRYTSVWRKEKAEKAEKPDAAK
jgi:serine/threonine protein kinase